MLSHRLQDTSLRYFLEVVRCGSLTDAARRLNVTVSAVSRQVAVLEEALGVPLFDRRPRGMVASAAGELLAAFALRGALDADRVVTEIAALQGLRRGRVRVASSAGFAIDFLPRAIAEFRTNYPGLHFHVRVSPPAEVTSVVLRGDADIGITYSRAAGHGIRVEHRQPAPVIAIMRPDHPLARFRSITLAQMQAHPIALPEGDNTVRQLFDIACSERGIVFEPVLVTNHFETLTSFVLHGGGLSISGAVTVGDRVRRGEIHPATIRERGMNSRVIELQTLAGRVLPEGTLAFLKYIRERLVAEGA